MSDGITDAIKEAKAWERWSEVILPHIIENDLHHKSPQELSPLENEWVYKYYMYEDVKPYLNLIEKSKQTAMRYWDAYLGQGKYKHYKYKGIVKVGLEKIGF